MLKAIIVDDEAPARSELRFLLDETGMVEVAAEAANVREAIEKLKEVGADIMFLDVNMPGVNGLQLAEALGKLKYPPYVIFVTAYSEHAVKAFEVNAVDYLLKPISYADFLTAANKAFEWFELKRRSVGKPSPAEAGPGSIFVKTEYRLRQIELDKILYIEGLKDYVKIYVEDEPRPVLSLISLKTLEEQLPAERFVRVHRSYIVQPSKIRIIERGRIVFGKTYIPVSDGYKEAFYAFLEARSLMPKSDK